MQATAPADNRHLPQKSKHHCSRSHAMNQNRAISRYMLIVAKELFTVPLPRHSTIRMFLLHAMLPRARLLSSKIITLPHSAFFNTAYLTTTCLTGSAFFNAAYLISTCLTFIFSISTTSQLSATSQNLEPRTWHLTANH